MSILKWFKDKAQAFRAALQSGRAKQFAKEKAHQRMRRSKSGKMPYVPSTIGVSAVSQRIMKDYGIVQSRRVRKLIAKRTGKSFKVYYNGPVVRVKPKT